MRPVEEIYHYDVYRKISAFILPCNPQDLILRFVAELALPESESILRHHGNLPRYIRIMMLNFRRCVRRGDPVIQLFGGFRVPFRQILSKRHRPDGWVIPEHPVSAAGNHKWNTCLRIPMRQLQPAAFQIKIRLLILPHSEQLFIFLRLKARIEAIVVHALVGHKRSRFNFQRTVEFLSAFLRHAPRALVFLKQFLSLSVLIDPIKDQLVHSGYLTENSAILQEFARTLFKKDNILIRFRRILFQRRQIRIRLERTPLRRSHPKAVAPPRLNPQQFLIPSLYQRIPFSPFHAILPIDRIVDIVQISIPLSLASEPRAARRIYHAHISLNMAYRHRIHTFGAQEKAAYYFQMHQGYHIAEPNEPSC